MANRNRNGRGRRLVITILAAAAAMIGACSLMRTNLPTREYFIINYTPNPPVNPASLRPYPYSLQVGRFDVPRIYNRQNIVFRFSPTQIEYYELQQWAVRPEDMIRDVVTQHLEAANLVNRLGSEFLDSRPDFRLDGTVEALEKYDAEDLFFAHLAMSFKLVRTSDGTQVWNYSFDQRRRVYSEEMVHTIVAASAIMETHMDTVISQLDSLFLALSTVQRLEMPSSSPQAVVPGTAAMPDTTAAMDKPAGKQNEKADEKIDESGFEIIPETR